MSGRAGRFDFSRLWIWAAVAILAGVLLVACGDGDSASQQSGGGGEGETVLEVRERGELNCGVKETQVGFGIRVADGSYEGFDIEFCKAIAAAVLDDPDAVKYLPASSVTRFELLVTKEIDVLIRTSTFTAERDAELGIDFVHTTFYTGQGFAVYADSGTQSTRDMEGATICVMSGTTTEQNLADHFTELGLNYTPLGGSDQETQDAFLAGRCEVWTAVQSNLVSRLSVVEDRERYAILPQIISKEPLTPAVREGDPEWRDIVNWVVMGLINAEELGVTRDNVDDWAANPPSIEVARLLGVPFGEASVTDLGFGIDPQFLQRAIRAVGNYGEIYERTVAAVGLPRACTLNALAIDDSVDCPAGQGGIQYVAPFR